MTQLDPKLRKALKRLSRRLRAAGYAADEQAAIVEGATERAMEYMQSQPDPEIDEAVRLIAGYGDPQFAPESGEDAPFDSKLARFAWIALAVAVVGITCLAPLAEILGGDGGAVMVLFVLIPLPLAATLSFLARRAQPGRVAGYATLCVCAAVGAVFLFA